jgi:chromosome segregation ATPase
MEAMREAWTDDRMDDLVKHLDEGFAQGRDDIRELRQQGMEFRRELKEQGEELRHELKEQGQEFRRELSEQGQELRGETKALRVEMNQQFVALNRRFDTLQATLLAAILAGLIGLVVSNIA